MTALQIVKIKKRSSSDPLLVNGSMSYVLLGLVNMRRPLEAVVRANECRVRSVGRPKDCSHSGGHCGVSH